jgi:FkbM family methyltransferase
LPGAAATDYQRGKDHTVNPILNWLVRAYLYRVPVTEGKKQLLRLTRDRIVPKGDIVTFTTRHGFRLTANLHNPEHQRMYFYGEHDERYEINILKKSCVLEMSVGTSVPTSVFQLPLCIAHRSSGSCDCIRTASSDGRLSPAQSRVERFHNVLIVRKAVGATPATRPIYYDDAASAEGTASFLSSHAEQDFEIVQIDTLDNLNGKLPAADFIKIDVEGYQMEVLDGGREYFAQHSPMIMAELKDRDRGKMQRAQDFFADCGYTPYEFEKRSLRRCENIASSRKRNFFMAKQDSPYQTRIERLVQAC